MVRMFQALEATGLRGFLLLVAAGGSEVDMLELAGEFEVMRRRIMRSDVVVLERIRLVERSDVYAKWQRSEVKRTSAEIEDFVGSVFTDQNLSFDSHKICFYCTNALLNMHSLLRLELREDIRARTKGDPAVTLGEAKTFPPLKILSAQIVNTYVATNKTIDARGELEEPDVDKVAIVKKKSVSKKKSGSTAAKDADEVPVEVFVEKVASKKRPAATSDAPVVKKNRTTTGKAASKKRDLGLIKFSLPAGSDDEIVEKEPAVEEPILDQSAGTEKMMELETYGVDEVENVVEQQISDFFKLLRKRWADVCIDVVQFCRSGHLQPVGSHNFCRDIVVQGSVVDIFEKVLTGFRGIFQHGRDTNCFVSYLETFVTQPDVQKLSSSSDGLTVYYSPSTRSEESISSDHPDLGTSDPVIHRATEQNPDSIHTEPIVQMGIDPTVDPLVFDNFSQRSTDQPTDSVFAEPEETAGDKFFRPTVTIPAIGFIDSFAQLQASISQLSIKQIRTKSSIGDLKNHLLSKIDNLEKALAEAKTEQDQSIQGLIKNVRQEVQTQKDALSIEMNEFKKAVWAQNAILILDVADYRKELGELVDYINRGGNDKKEEENSSRGPQPPPNDRRDKSDDGGRDRGNRSDSSSKRYFSSGVGSVFTDPD
ncbi:eukaryotic translation initiation factor 5B-like [Dorcoceras hygrometricum]|uniref:Eukaryotic translation initiation factor 5B-like n=1 Tax=Dorcoceras hygrometricum TaxID=472368 RepID=A0A2Z7C315_9LAMI|nr:eukaryotic translation initiation factor 5B-like [Dorcoceras hygrometricum]